MQQDHAKKSKNPLTWLISYFFEAKEEMRKVTWPSQKETMKYSVLVVIICLLVAVFFGGLDWILNLGMEQLINLVS